MYQIETPYTIGLDLGQASDFTAICVLESQLWMPAAILAEYPWQGLAPGWNSPSLMNTHALSLALTHGKPWPNKPPLHLRHLERMRGKPYPDIVTRVAEMVQQPPFTDCGYALVVDATGVGAPVVDLFRQAEIPVMAIMIHGGDAVTPIPGEFYGQLGGYRVPKRDLVAALQSVLQAGRLVIAEGLELAPEFRKESQNFKVRIDPKTAHDSYSHWREGQHDDLVLATAMGCWFRDYFWRHHDAQRIQRRDAA